MANSLTLKEEAYLRERISNPTQGLEASAIAAGYAPKSAGKQANRIEKKPEVKKRLEEEQAKALERARLGADDLNDVLDTFILTDLPDYFESNGQTPKPLSELTKKQRAAIETYEIKHGPAGSQIKIKLYSKLQAIAEKMKLNGLGKEKLEVTGGVTPIIYLPAKSEPKKAEHGTTEA